MLLSGAQSNVPCGPQMTIFGDYDPMHLFFLAVFRPIDSYHCCCPLRSATHAPAVIFFLCHPYCVITDSRAQGGYAS
jgi:hypothetical protein